MAACFNELYVDRNEYDAVMKSEYWVGLHLLDRTKGMSFTSTYKNLLLTFCFKVSISHYYLQE